MLEFECDPLALGTLSYDYGGTIGEEVRKTFDLLYTDAIEFDPEFGHEASFVDAVLEYHARQQMFSYHLRLTMMIELGVVRRDEGALDTFVSQATTQDDAVLGVCEVAPPMIDRLSPELLRRLRWQLHLRIRPEPI